MKGLLKGLILAVSAAMAMPCFAQRADELLSQGREAFMNYDFSRAASLYAQAKKKAKRNDEFFADKYDTFRHQLTEAENFLDRVEKIVVIDSITVPRHEFFRAYRLSPSSGSLSGAEGLPGKRIDGVDYVFTNEGGDYKLWSQPDSTGYMVPFESMVLTDGKWSEPSPLWEDLTEDSDAIFPFLMSDGVTLYYADNGENSIGGYDIMVATRDAADGSFLQPSNLGFPYNSPYDDYLLAIDELNGVGWWATDRNNLDDELTIYVFLTNDLRVNYPSDEENIVGFARIDDYIATQPEDGEYDDILETIRSINPGESAKKAEFTLQAPKGKVYHNYEDLPNAASRAAMKKYVAAENDLKNSLSALDGMRRMYHENASRQLGDRIAALEKTVEKKRAELDKLRSEVYKSLGR